MICKTILIFALASYCFCIWDQDFEIKLDVDEYGNLFEYNENNANQQADQVQATQPPVPQEHHQYAGHLTKVGRRSTIKKIQDDMTILIPPNGPEITIQDAYRLSLSHKYQLVKVLSVAKSTNASKSMITITTWITNKEKFYYPFHQVKSADTVMLNRAAFIKLINFFYSSSMDINFSFNTTYYRFAKHFDIAEYPHITIQQINRDEAYEKDLDHPSHVFRGVVLDLKEFQNLLSRSNQILEDMSGKTEQPKFKEQTKYKEDTSEK